MLYPKLSVSKPRIERETAKPFWRYQSPLRTPYTYWPML